MDQEPIVVKEASTPSLSGQSTLTYEIGTDQASIALRVCTNSGTGYFSSEWIKLDAIQAVFADSPETFTWEALKPIFAGKSVNSACFLMAVLLNEHLVCRSEKEPRRYERCDPKPFIAGIKALTAKPKKRAKPPPITDPPADSEPHLYQPL